MSLVARHAAQEAALGFEDDTGLGFRVAQVVPPPEPTEVRCERCLAPRPVYSSLDGAEHAWCDCFGQSKELNVP